MIRLLVGPATFIVLASSACASPDLERCQVPSDAFMNRLASGLDISGEGSIRDWWAVKSQDAEDMYFVSATIDGPGMGGGQIATWATNRIGGGHGPIFSTDAMADEFSEWPLAVDVGSGMAIDGAWESQDCVKHA